MQAIIDQKDLKEIQSSTIIRSAIARNSFEFFLEIYFSHYLTAPFWKFHHEIFRELEDPLQKLITIMAFRGSGKSSIVSTAFAIWAILGKMDTKYVVIVAQTQQQAKQYMKNLKEELETNMFLRKDLGPFEEDGSEWNNSSLILKNFWARITVVSVDQSIRWIRHKNHRPELILADDIENLQSMKTRDGRNNLYEWFTKELVPIGDIKKTRIIILGNMLHWDSLLMRMKNEIENGKRSGKFLRYPLLNEEWICIWPERYSEKDIIDLRLSIGSEIAWRTEYLLEEAGFEGQVIKPEWISWFDEFPVATWPRTVTTYNGKGGVFIHDSDEPFMTKIVTWVDLAISESSSADFTAFVTGAVFGKHENKSIFIVDAFAKRMDFPTTMGTLRTYDATKRQLYPVIHKIYVEKIGYQAALEQSLKGEAHMKIEGWRPTMSKIERLTLVSQLIKDGRIKFAKSDACKVLVEQILGFWKEPHDDLVDAFTMLVLATMEEKDISVFLGVF